MAAAVNVFADKGKAAIPTETVRALYNFLLVLEDYSVYRDRLMHQILPMIIFNCMGIQGLDVQRQVRGSASLYVSGGYWV